MLFRSEGYTFVSRGSDGAPDPDSEALLEKSRAGFSEVKPPPLVKTACFESDIIFTMGLALKYPDGKQRSCKK